MKKGKQIVGEKVYNQEGKSPEKKLKFKKKKLDKIY